MIDDRDVEYDLKYFNSEIKDRNCQPCRCLTIPWWINQPAKVSDLAWIFRQASSAIYQTPRLVQVPLKFGYCVFIHFKQLGSTQNYAILTITPLVNCLRR